MMLLGGPLVLRAAAVTGGVIGALSLTAACAPDGKFLTWGGPLAIGLGGVCMACLGKWNRYHLLTVLWCLKWNQLVFDTFEFQVDIYCTSAILIYILSSANSDNYRFYWNIPYYFFQTLRWLAVLQAWCSSYYLMNSTNVEVMYLAKLEICIIFGKATK